MPRDAEQRIVMVVDNDPITLDAVEATLEGQGYLVRCFADSIDAFNSAKKYPPDLILLDIEMPSMNGLDFCCRLKKHKDLNGIPVIFISGHQKTDMKVIAFGQGGVDYVTKPIDDRELNARVKTHLELRSLQVELERKVLEKTREITETQMATIFALAKLAEYRDTVTGKHLERVQIFCKTLSEKMLRESCYTGELNETFVDNIYHAAPLHDIGKVGMPDRLLMKTSELSPQEFEEMKRHSTLGAETLQDVKRRYAGNAFLDMGIEIARSHHERWDGQGYPAGLKELKIPLSARIMAIVDTYDAIRSKRRYKEAESHKYTVTMVDSQAHAGKFDPVIVKIFLSVEAEFEEIYSEMDV